MGVGGSDWSAVPVVLTQLLTLSGLPLYLDVTLLTVHPGLCCCFLPHGNDSVCRGILPKAMWGFSLASHVLSLTFLPAFLLPLSRPQGWVRRRMPLVPDHSFLFFK